VQCIFMQLYHSLTVAVVINQANNRVCLRLVLVILMVVVSVKTYLGSSLEILPFLYISFYLLILYLWHYST
jgi:hypothetical protein